MLRRVVLLGLMLLYVVSIVFLFKGTGNSYIALYLRILLPPTLFGMAVGSYFLIPLLLQGSLSDKRHCRHCGYRVLESQDNCSECGELRLTGNLVEENKFGSTFATASFIVGLVSLVPCGMPVALGLMAVVIGLVALASHRITPLSKDRLKYAFAGIWIGILALIGFGLTILLVVLTSETNIPGVPY